MRPALNTASVGNLARSVWSDLREKRLWPVVLVLAVGLVAVPVLLSRSPASPPPGSALADAGGAPGAIPAVSVQSSASRGYLRGAARDPFGQPPGAPGQGTGTTQSATTPATGGTLTGSAASSAATPVTGGGSSGAASAPTPTSTAVSGSPPAGGAPAPPVPPHKPTPPAPSGLSPDQSYDVEISITDSSGGLRRIDPVQRLSLLPNAQQPVLAELGVLQDTHRVLFAVAPGTVLYGPGSCVPGPIDCEILSLGEDQVEALATTPNSPAVAMFAVTGITTTDHPSAAAAQQARQAESAAGKQFMATLSLPALSLFQYSASVGAMVDLRTLAVGGS